MCEGVRGFLIEFQCTQGGSAQNVYLEFYIMRSDFGNEYNLDASMPDIAEHSTAAPAPRTIYLKDYQAPSYFVDEVELGFELDPQRTLVRSRLHVRRNPTVAGADAPLLLDGVDLQLLSLHLDGAEVAAERYHVDAEQLCIEQVPEHFVLDVVNTIEPARNTVLEGLFSSGEMLCTQCEAEGFRRITYYPDRPDVMSRYRVTLIADKQRYPVLLSNGNPVEQGDFDATRHYAVWHDPSLKPCYLFALVTGDLAHIEDRFVTLSGREVTLRIYSEAENITQCEHAMHSLQQAMRWDEEKYGREYELDLYMIVAVNRFNMGAMENKGLNIFNAPLVLASPATATDMDYFAIQKVIGHEYFHNWSGNRVTCRDWFQLSLKEGFTVFRDQQFSADMNSAGVVRIDTADRIRSGQFVEDAGPMAHPVRPVRYIQVFNFYTSTVYSKGAEVVRMLSNLLGREMFRRGCDLYFSRHDGQAVTCDDFVQTMEDVSSIDLSQFKRWYSQAGTPELTVRGDYDAAQRRYTLHVAQHTPPTPNQDEKLPQHIPFAVGLLDAQGNDMPLRLQGEERDAPTTRVLPFRETEQSFVFENVGEAPVPSLLRGFSAPVKVRYARSEEELAFLLAHDSDDFNRWDAGQQLALAVLLRQIEALQKGAEAPAPALLTAALARALENPALDPAMLARILRLPSLDYIAEHCAVIDVDAVYESHEFTRRYLARALYERLLQTYEQSAVRGPYRFDRYDAARRALRNTCLGYLCETEAAEDLHRCYRQFQSAGNMSEVFPALAMLCKYDVPERQHALDAFYAEWRDDAQVVLKWLGIQAASFLPGALARVRELMRHPAYDTGNPNHVGAVIGGFSWEMSPRFHAADGSGYAFLAEQVLAQDKINPKTAAHLARALIRHKRYAPARGESMRGALQRISAQGQLSKDVYEVVARGLA